MIYDFGFFKNVRFKNNSSGTLALNHENCVMSPLPFTDLNKMRLREFWSDI